MTKEEVVQHIHNLICDDEEVQHFCHVHTLKSIKALDYPNEDHSDDPHYWSTYSAILMSIVSLATSKLLGIDETI